MTKPFWEVKSLDQMTEQEWESLCDGCAKCCLHKFIEDDDAEHETTEHIETHEEMHFTNVVCRYLNTKTCDCTCYDKRTKLVPDCVKLTKDNLKDVFYMPFSCTYRRLYEGRGLPSWHPLLHKGKKSEMHKAGMSVRNKVIKDDQVDLDDFEDYIVIWPLGDVD